MNESEDPAVWEHFGISQLVKQSDGCFMKLIFTSLQLLNSFHAEVSNIKIKNLEQKKNTFFSTLRKQ